ncbi:MBL fold metallo-hydrolase [Deinococcus cavernae]|uniref:MBL fold metallo-hydrolase n=1 Tax=Deinococcus cavernae TaxID=2320857 RepID=A0A418VD33_9DEIO|nr:MBL fold metallo-hydrolase [Deinococcus cavernae]
MKAALTFLGTADSKGVPRFWCNCPVCREARGTGVNRRTRTALLLQQGKETVLLDAGGDLHVQLAWLNTAIVPDTVVLSHAHNDHILGLADLLDYVHSARGTVQIYAPAVVVPDLAARFPYAFKTHSPVTPMPFEGVEAAGFNVQLFRVPHGANGFSHAFLLARPDFRAVIMTDSLDVPADLAAEWLRDLDLLVLGTAFVDESGFGPQWGRSVYDIREARALPWAQAARRVVLTHLSHDVDVRNVELPGGWMFARDGLTITL